MRGRSAGSLLQVRGLGGTAPAASDLDASHGLDGLLRTVRQGLWAPQIRSHCLTALANTGSRLTCRRTERRAHRMERTI